MKKYPKGKHPNSRNGFKKGRIVSDEVRRKLSETHKRLGIKPPSRKGVRLSEVYKKRLSRIAKKKGFGKWMTGRKLSFETREKCRQSQLNRVKEGKSNFYRGGKDSAWQGGKTKRLARLRTSAKYKSWRMKVFIRDRFKCTNPKCKKRKGARINADHIKPFCDYLKLRYDIRNGRTLCEDCHKETPTYGHNSKLKK